MTETPEEREQKFINKIQAFQTELWLSPADMIELLLNEAQRRIELNQKWEARG